MKFKVVEYPVKHLIVEGYLNQDEMDKCMEELKSLSNSFEEGRWYTPEKGIHINHDIKKCIDLDLHGFYGEDYTKSYIVREIIMNKFWTKELRKFYDSTGSDSIFSYLNETDFNTSIIAGFKSGDHYDWHSDFGLATANVMLSNAEGIEGGDFILSNKCGFGDNERIVGSKFETITYEYKPGMMILFPARFQHMVTETKTKSNNIEDMRFTLQSRCHITKF